MEMEYTLGEITEAARQLVAAAGEAKVWAFSGEMGAGKTTLIHTLCRAMGVQGTMSSPTFSIINEYSVAGNAIYHIDLYRCNSEEEAVRAGVEDCLYSGKICLVEWPSKAPSLFPADTLQIDIRSNFAGARKLTISRKEEAAVGN